ncbi:hypothetical protein HPP92_008346 [Vanilla planifolia]|uniref:RRM domain-containing protein n=1 Tax=Vanilla planifolia TaxID=51239 RepID=A0A835V7T8_VANPL|nr:hypothetical protein HPP92_008346 [Vanilla planifolia]
MDSDQGKLFIGGISWETTEDKLKDYFGKYGDVLHTIVSRDKITGRPRGFGFVVFADPSIIDCVLQDSHNIDGRTVDAKKAMSREEQFTAARSGNNLIKNAGINGCSTRTKKIFVGGLPPTLSDLEFRHYFEAYGIVTDVVVMYDQHTQRPRGFGFISFDSEDSVELVLENQFHEVGGKKVEVKRALPKDANSSLSTNRTTLGGGYQSYGSSSDSSNSYDNRIDVNRYMQAPPNGPGYHPYGSSAYGAPSYGYGTASNGVDYGGYGDYGNPMGPATAYVSGPPVASRGTWNNQVPAGYGSASYEANAGYGGAGPWNAPGSGGPVSGQTGQPPNTVASYGNQRYGYGGSEGPYGSQVGYGTVGGRGGLAGNPIGSAGDQGGGPVFPSGSYSDGSGNTGYSTAWRSDPAQGGGYGVGQVNNPLGGTIGYAGGYGGSQSRQAQP